VHSSTFAVVANDQRWRGRAMCDPNNGHDPNIWFPPSIRQHSTGARARAAMALQAQSEAQAKELCAACPVQRECLEYANDNEEPDGIWGGLTPIERRKEPRR
jgi:WhiB family transcriptional regulator, redox-sensing transcriptional regulator